MIINRAPSTLKSVPFLDKINDGASEPQNPGPTANHSSLNICIVLLEFWEFIDLLYSQKS